MRFGMHEAGHTRLTDRLSATYFYGGKGSIDPGWYVEDITKGGPDCLVSGPHCCRDAAIHAGTDVPESQVPVEFY